MTSSTIYNSELYPLHDLSQMQHLIRQAQESIEQTGVVIFKNFLRPEVVEQSVQEILPLCSNAFVSDKKHDVYLNVLDTDNAHPDMDSSRYMETKVASVAYDELGANNTMSKLYQDPRLTRFITQVLKKEPDSFHVLADPIGAATINVFNSGYKHAWHFDESEYTTTLCLQMPESGGEFVYTNLLRDSSEDLAKDAVAEAVKGNGETFTLDFEPGTLALFAGRYSLHKVNEVFGNKSRLVAVFCYSCEKGHKHSASVQKQFWGRSKL